MLLVDEDADDDYVVVFDQLSYPMMLQAASSYSEVLEEGRDSFVGREHDDDLLRNERMARRSQEVVLSRIIVVRRRDGSNGYIEDK
jgi:hypothetical protein